MSLGTVDTQAHNGDICRVSQSKCHTKDEVVMKIWIAFSLSFKSNFCCDFYSFGDYINYINSTDIMNDARYLCD